MTAGRSTATRTPAVVDRLPGITVVDVRVETEPAVGERASVIATLHNRAEDDRGTVVTFLLNGDVVTTETRSLSPGATEDVVIIRTLHEAGIYRFGAVVATRDPETGLPIQLPPTTAGTVTVEESSGECSWLGHDLGGYGACWYWWVPITGGAGLLAFLVAWLRGRPGTGHEGQSTPPRGSRLFRRNPEARRRLDRWIVAGGVVTGGVVALVTTGAIVGLPSMGVSDPATFSAAVLGAVAIGLGIGTAFSWGGVRAVDQRNGGPRAVASRNDDPKTAHSGPDDRRRDVEGGDG